MTAKNPKPATKPIVLNDEQRAVVSAKQGFWKVEAGPGAGKSACLVSRFSSLIQEGVSPDDILFFNLYRDRRQESARPGRTTSRKTFH